MTKKDLTQTELLSEIQGIVSKTVTKAIRENNEDFKQYVDHTVGNAVNSAIRESEERIKKELTAEIRDVRDDLRNEMRDGFSGVAEAIEGHQDQIDDHDTRITKLEHKIA